MTICRWMKLGIAASATAATIACSDGFAVPDGMTLHSAAREACGPSGGPAVEIYLASEPIETFEPDPPYVRIYIPGPVSDLAGETLVLAGAEPDATAWFYLTATESEAASSGSLVVLDVEGNNTVEGRVDATFPQAGRIRGEFRAPWIPRSSGCP